MPLDHETNWESKTDEPLRKQSRELLRAQLSELPGVAMVVDAPLFNVLLAGSAEIN